MTNVKVSLITVVRNRVDMIAGAILSARAQSYPYIEHVIIDGASTDGTISVIQDLIDSNTIFISEPDRGIYDALNKGIAHATGDVIGVLHSDDFFADDSVIADVAKLFEDPSVDIVYGDLDYVSQSQTEKIIRRWRAGKFSRLKLSWGWMPPHPTVFVRRSIIESHGAYDTNYKISGDYDSLLRYFSAARVCAVYLPRILVKMRIGGASNASIKHIGRKMKEDYRALKSNKIGGIGSLISKNLSKISQFFFRA